MDLFLVTGYGGLIVLLIRLLVPLTIFKWPLWGTVASLLADMLDVVIADLIGMGGYVNYVVVDKILDVYYLSFAFIISLKWEKLARNTSIFLFVYRMFGFVLFWISGERVYLFIFQNLFENFFIFEAVRQKYFAGWKLTKKRLFIALFILLIPKMIQEYALHYLELQPWQWIKSVVGWTTN